MIDVVFPDLCRVILSGSLREGAVNYSHTELKVAFARLAKQLPDDLRICFFIDGIDEYTGDHNDICDIFSEVTKHPSIKAVLSSRPIPVCVDRLEDCPGLRVQDLTRMDIELYVSDHLGIQPLMKKMEQGTPGTTDALTRKIIDRASGGLSVGRPGRARNSSGAAKLRYGRRPDGQARQATSRSGDAVSPHARQDE